jgi:hypothetical protein
VRARLREHSIHTNARADPSAYTAAGPPEGAAPEVPNQSTELLDYDLFSTHSALREAFGTLPPRSDFAALTTRVLSA